MTSHPQTATENLCGKCRGEFSGETYSVGWLDAAGEWRGKMTVCGRCAPSVLAQQDVEMGLEQIRVRWESFGKTPVSIINFDHA